MTARTRKETTTTMKITVSATDLIAGLTAVMPHAGTDASLPMLSSVKFESTDKELWLAATDRYTIGAFHMPAEGGDFNTLVSLSTVKQALAIVKLGQSEFKKFPTDVTLEVKEMQLYVTAGMETHMLRGRIEDAQFPQWRSLLKVDDTAGAGDRVTGFNPANLARFVRAGEKDEPMKCYQAGSNKPMVVAVGTKFVGAVMPVRVEATWLESVLPSWMRGEPAVTPTVRNPIIVGGKTYHRVDCKSIKGAQQVVTLAAALANDDWSPCAVCTPPVETEVAA